MRKKMLITCGEMIPFGYRVQLKGMFDVTEVACALNEEELKQAILEIDVVVIGGEEFYTLDVLRIAKPTIRFIFVGVQGDTAFSKTALEYHGGVEKILLTGGGLDEVARMTVAEIADPHVRKALLTQKMRDFRWTSASEMAKEMAPLSELEVTVIGAGGIGSLVLAALDGKVKKLVYFDPFGENKNITSPTISWEPQMAKAFCADIVTIHLRLGPATENIITDKHLKRIRKFFINNSRAALVERYDFARYLENGGKAIWDVFYIEGAGYEALKKDTQSVLGRISHSANFILTSHTAAFSPKTFEEYGQGLMRVIAENNLADQ